MEYEEQEFEEELSPTPAPETLGQGVSLVALGAGANRPMVGHLQVEGQVQGQVQVQGKVQV